MSKSPNFKGFAPFSRDFAYREGDLKIPPSTNLTFSSDKEETARIQTASKRKPQSIEMQTLLIESSIHKDVHLRVLGRTVTMKTNKMTDIKYSKEELEGIELE